MKENEVRQRAFAMPLTSPAYPIGPYRFINREYLVITYRTDPKKLRELVPEPLQIDEPLVKFEFIRMPDSTGFGDYTESGQVIPVSLKGRKGGYSHCMFLNDHPPIAGGRELWGFPKKLAEPTLRAEIDTLVGTLDYGKIRIATGTMGYKHTALDHAAVAASLAFLAVNAVIVGLQRAARSVVPTTCPLTSSMLRVSALATSASRAAAASASSTAKAAPISSRTPGPNMPASIE